MRIEAVCRAEQGARTEVRVAQHVDERVHVRLGGEVNARAHVAQRRVDVLRVRSPASAPTHTNLPDPRCLRRFKGIFGYHLSVL